MKRIEFVDGKCPYWEIEVDTGSRLGYANVRSTKDPNQDFKKYWAYVIVWTAVNKPFGCSEYSLRVPYERDAK